MSSRKSKLQTKGRPIKRLLDEILPKKSPPKSKIIVRKVVYDDDEDTKTPSSSYATAKEIISTSSSTLKRVEEIKKEKIGTEKTSSPDPTLLGVPLPSAQITNSQQSNEERPLVSANSQFFYSPIYRRYFGLTPPNPRLCNPRLLEDYIDWYVNVYMEEEELPWQWISVGNSAERVKQGEDEAKEQADRLASIPSTFSEKKLDRQINKTIIKCSHQY